MNTKKISKKLMFILLVSIIFIFSFKSYTFAVIDPSEKLQSLEDGAKR